MGPASGPHLSFPCLARLGPLLARPRTASVPGRPRPPGASPRPQAAPRPSRTAPRPPPRHGRSPCCGWFRRSRRSCRSPRGSAACPQPRGLVAVPRRSGRPDRSLARPGGGAAPSVPADAEHTCRAAAPLRQNASSGAPGIAPGAPFRVHRPVRKPSWSGYGTVTAGTPAGEGVRLRRWTRVFSTDVGTISRPQAGDCWTVPSVSTGHPGERGSSEVSRVWICGKPSSTGCGQHFVHRAPRSVVHCLPTAQPALCTALAAFSTPLSTVRQRDTLSHRTE